MTRRQSHARSLAHVVLILAVVAVLAGGAAWLLRRSGSPRYHIRNVLLISIDTCRADYLSCYGYERQTTPHIDALANEGILFENAISPVPLTLPAHCSMLTGTIPPYHLVHDNLDYRLGDSHLTLAEILKKQGFATGAVISAFVLDSQFGLSQGFDTYNDRFDEDLGDQVVQRGGAEVTRYANEWLQQHQEDQFFLFLHYYDPHAEYAPPEPFATQFAGTPYAGEIAYADHCIAQVIDELKSLNLFDSTLIIVTSDHGEMLAEHGEWTHGYFIYQSGLRIPLIFRIPGQRTSRRVTELTGLVDVVPTICSLLSIAPPPDCQGIDLSQWFHGQPPSPRERHLYCESLLPTKYGANPLLGVMTGRFNYIHTTRAELYDLQDDPGELDNLAATRPQRVAQLQDQLKQILLEQSSDDQAASQSAAGAQATSRVEALGYIGATTSGDLNIDPQKDDPKGLIDFHTTYNLVGNLLFNRKFDRARQLTEDLVAERPLFWGGHHKLGAALVGLGELENGLEHFRRAVQLEPESAKAQLDLARILSGAGYFDEAIGHYKEALQLAPHDPLAHFYLGIAMRSSGQLQEAATHFRQTLELDPNHAEAHYQLAVPLLGAGEWAEAIPHLQESLELESNNASAHGNLGVALEQLGKVDEAIRHFRRSLELNPFSETHYNLANALRSQGKLDEAAAEYRNALQLNSNDVKSMNNLAMTLSAQGRIQEAIELYRRVLQIDPEDAKAQNNLERLQQ